MVESLRVAVFAATYVRVLAPASLNAKEAAIALSYPSTLALATAIDAGRRAAIAMGLDATPEPGTPGERRVMLAELAENVGDGSGDGSCAGTVVRVVVPSNCTIYSADARRLARVVDLAKKIGETYDEHAPFGCALDGTTDLVTELALEARGLP